MQTIAFVVLAVALLVAVAALVVVARRKPASGALDEESVRRLLRETLSAAPVAPTAPARALVSSPTVLPTPSTASAPSAPAIPVAPAIPSAPDRSGRPAAGRSGDDKSVQAPVEQVAITGRPPGPARAVGGPVKAGAAFEGLDPATVAALRQEAMEVAAEIRRAAAEAAEELREHSRADADRLRADARADAERTVAGARVEVAGLRAGLADERARMTREVQAVVAAERIELTAGQHRLGEATALVEADRQTVGVERERTRGERDELDRARISLDRREELLREQLARAAARESDMDRQELDLRDAGARVEHELVRVSGLTVGDARAELLAAQHDAVRRDAALMIRRVETEARTEAKSRARAIVAEAVQRVASDQTAQTVVTVMHLPSDDVKGRIIGREGRNIRAFETVTGVNVIIDDTPEAVLLSCFDPVRREIGRVTLQSLIEDGRIHPHRIEEAYERAIDEVEGLCRRAAEDALLEVGINNLHPELVTYIGRLKYRTSYGQNVLGHLIETSHIARTMAAELGIDAQLVARGAFLHDIGKALTHEAQGSHALVGAELARRYGESEEVAHCIEAHHDEVLPTTVEAVLTQAADACSGGRPGARRESLESYVQRLERIEAIASAKKGVDKVFAMQAGRELRVMVKPDVVDDLEAHVLAREVAKQIEEELTYPGQVRVTVIRESRATEIAR